MERENRGGGEEEGGHSDYTGELVTCKSAALLVSGSLGVKAASSMATRAVW